MTFGFIITRHCTNEKNNYFKTCYEHIRQFYDNEIVVIDDNSTLPLNENEFSNVRVIISSFPGKGELLPYVYFYKYKYFDKAIILHDSMFIQEPFTIDIENIDNVRFLWSFNEQEPYYKELTTQILTLINISPDIYDNKQWEDTDTNCWFGCFGASCIISHSFLCELERRFCFISPLLFVIRERFHRMCFERVFSIMCYKVLGSSLQPSLFGNIVKYMPYGTTYEHFINNPGDFHRLQIVKTWSGR